MTAEKTAIVRMKVTDAEPFCRFTEGVAEASRCFSLFDDRALAGLPAEAWHGIKVLRQAVAEFTGEAPPSPRREPEPYRGEIIIEWPPPAGDLRHPMIGCMVTVYDAATGEQIKTVSRADITVHGDAAELVTADLVMFADEQGEPILDGAPVLDGGMIRTGVFPFLVAAMRIRAATPRAIHAAGGRS